MMPCEWKPFSHLVLCQNTLHPLTRSQSSLTVLLIVNEEWGECGGDGKAERRETLSFSPFPSCLRAPLFRVKTTEDESAASLLKPWTLCPNPPYSSSLVL